MAATDSPDSSRLASRRRPCLSPAELTDRLDEEIGRAERHNTALSCLVVRIEDVQRLASVHGPELPEQALAYLGDALQRQMRRFDRVGRPREGELAVVLPGAGQRHAEAVARRALGRLHAVKIELDGVRRPLHVSVGIAAWRDGLGGAELLTQARTAAQGAGRGDAATTGAAAADLVKPRGEEPPAPAGGIPVLRPS